MSEATVILAYEALAPEQDAHARGRALVFGLLTKVTGRPFDGGMITYGPRGKPLIAGAPEFSISHCAGLVAAAVSVRGAIGIDVEPIARVMGRALRKVCDAEELLMAERSNPASVWVAKEAAIKCLGLSAFMAGQVRLREGRAALQGQVLHVAHPLLADGFATAVATPERIVDNELVIHHPRAA